MILELAYITAAAVISLILFIALDIFWKLPKEGGVSGADAISREIVAAGGDKNGGWMLGNIICSPDASAGTLLAACGYWICGIPGGIAVAVLVFIGARICADKGWAGTSGALAATIIIWALSTFAGFPPEAFIAGMIIAILLVQGISPLHASRALGSIWRKI
ncbi:hypothetical protein O0S10_04025 [Methanocorpusculum sp. MG]|uniref:Uncharacterized protein n=1 Tax=Methanocorpusculum petauri TaxID=3002863 RepID=A0ABT4IGP0_9EURY|nr:hypothetical protein [Methanocorpusculum petauri]MCZ0860397.1 hypothetical protein [Methanocorpusculum petauri]MDE2443360.1 hypothetical protein [Methanocorpusculum sp.]